MESEHYSRWQHIERQPSAHMTVYIMYLSTLLHAVDIYAKQCRETGAVTRLLVPHGFSPSLAVNKAGFTCT